MSELNPHRQDRSAYDADIPAMKMLLGGFGLLFVLVTSLATEIGRDVFFGWFLFLDRRLATFQPDGPTWWVGVGAFAILFAIVHRLGRRWCSQPTSDTTVTQYKWTWRSTTSVCVGITLLFAASVAMVASLHQLIWLAGNASSTSQKSGQWSRRAGPLSPVTQVRQSTWRTQSKNNLKQLMLGMHNYHDVYSQFPPGAIVGPDGRGYRGWLISMNGYLGFYTNHEVFQKAWDDPTIADLGRGALYETIHPELGWHGQFDDRGFALMHYAGNVHVFPNNRGLKISEITDGTSNTLAIGEVAENFQPWASPWNRRDPADGINDVPWGFGGPTWQGGAQFALMDGTVRLISRNIDRQVLKALGTPAGNERIANQFDR